jgi:hypothetical protein
MHQAFGAQVDPIMDEMHRPPVDGEACGASGEQ